MAVLTCGSTVRNFTGSGQANAPSGFNVNNLAQQASAKAIQDANKKVNAFLKTALCPIKCGGRSHTAEVTSVNITQRTTRNSAGIAITTFRATANIKVTVKCKSIKSLITIDTSDL